MDVNILDWDATSCSTHVPLYGKLYGLAVTQTPQARMTNPTNLRIKWDKSDLSLYRDTVDEALTSWRHPLSSEQEIDAAINYLTETLLDAAKEAALANKPKKKRHSCGIIPPNTLVAIKEGRKANWLWKEAGCPGYSHPLSQRRREISHNIRKLQRIQNAKHRDMKLTKIMEASSHDQKTFHRLIKDQRTNTRATKTYIDGCSDPDEAASKWKDHFENLATPKPTEPDEGSAWNTIDDMITKLISFNKRLEPPRPLCSLEVLQAIRRLNRGKAPDTHGVSAEHLLYVDLQTADLLTSIFNAIIRSGHIPQSFKDGVITPNIQRRRKTDRGHG